MKSLRSILPLLFCFCSCYLVLPETFAQNIPVKPGKDSVSKKPKGFGGLSANSSWLNDFDAPPVKPLQIERVRVNKEPLFYFIASLLLFLGILRVSFDRYFGNLLRVFFNTSLRQSQLTDQLLQAKLPSLFFNIFFILIGGVYIFLLLVHFGKIPQFNWLTCLWCIAGVGILYFGKYAIIRFSGWVTDYGHEADAYVFIVFLVNKMIALLLVPLVIVIAFADPGIRKVAVIVSLVLVSLMFLLRFLRSYGLLRQRLKFRPLHFSLYIFGVEILPILLIYKGALEIMHKSL